MNYLYYFLIYLVAINLIGFFAMLMDKNRSKKKLYRISEKKFFTIALFLGATGIYLGMYKFRHKTQHKTFTILIPVLIILNLISIYYILSNITEIIIFASGYIK